MKVKRFLVSVWLGLVLSAVSSGQEVKVEQNGYVKATRTYQPVKQLDFELEVPASVSQVWEALSTTGGLITWLGPEASVQLKKGGDWLVRFPGSSAGGGTVLSFVPGQRLELGAMAPEAFPTVRRERTRAVFEIRAKGQTTVVHLTQSGWKSGEEWDRAFEYLAKGNCQLLNALHDRFANGPVDWKPILKGLAK